MNCLNDYIGLRYCTGGNPLSGVWINDYPAMQTELLEKISSPEQVSYLGLWESVQRVAYQRLKRDIQAALFKSANVRLDQVLFQTSKEFVQNWQQIETLPAAAEFRGVFMAVQGSKYLGVNIKQVYVYNASGAPVTGVPLKIFQTQDGKALVDITVDLVEGMNYIPVNEVIYSDFDKVNLLVAVDCTNLTTTQGNFVDYGWNMGDYECAQPFYYISQNGWDIFPVTAPLNYGLGQSWNQSTSQTGVYVDATLVCSLDAFICAQKEFLIDVWANLLCHQILWTKMGSNRANYFAQGNRENTNAAMATFMDSYTQGLNIWANQLNLRQEGLCFNCGAAGLIQQGSVRP
jgi:hypothetical protein